MEAMFAAGVRRKACHPRIGPGVICVLFVMLTACATAPYTQRSQLILISSAQEARLGARAFRQVLEKEPVSQDPVHRDLVTRVGSRIARAVNRPEFRWEFVVIDKPKTANAFALPGGKVAVYTGIFPTARTEAGLAAVIAHEVGHVLARHGAERLSQGLLARIGATALQVGMAGKDPGVIRGVMTAYGLGAQVGVLLPYGRLQEREADRIGLILMARAGYDPRAAIDLWKRMAQSDKRRPPEFLSTHPSPGNRAADLRRWLPEALAAYQRSAKAPEGTRLLPGVTGAAVREPTPAKTALPSPGDLAVAWEWVGEAGARFPSLRFIFQLPWPVRVEEVSIEGPDGIGHVVFIARDLAANDMMEVLLPASARPETGLPPGAYVVRVRGQERGRPISPFTTTLTYQVR